MLSGKMTREMLVVKDYKNEDMVTYDENKNFQNTLLQLFLWFDFVGDSICAHGSWQNGALLQ